MCLTLCACNYLHSGTDQTTQEDKLIGTLTARKIEGCADENKL